MEFEVEIEDATPDAVLDVLVAGILVGQVSTDASGNGELALSSDPDADDLPLPADFPEVIDGTDVSVGTLQGTLALETED